MLIRNNWGEHLKWIAGVIAGTILTTVLYVAKVNDTGWEGRPSGSTGWLFWFGVLGGAICFFEFLLWPRKKFRASRSWLWPAKTWMKAHIWLGLLAVPLLLYHSSFKFQNQESTILFVLFVIVILSGVWGLFMQQYIPEKLLREVQAETIFSQLDHVANTLVLEAENLVIATCGESAERAVAAIDAEEAEKVLATGGAAGGEVLVSAHRTSGGEFHVGAERVASGFQAKLLQSRAFTEPVPGSEPLRVFFNDVLADYLRRGKASGSDLADAEGARVAFTDLRLKLDPRAHETVDELEKMAAERRQLDRQAVLHFWLHNWLWVHLPLSVALIVLMFVHIYVTINYWWPY